MKYNFILHTTTFCNYNCSYCDVIKNKKKLKDNQVGNIIKFINENIPYINNFKFFGGEPLLDFENIKKIIDSTYNQLGKKYQIVSNTSLLNKEIGLYFRNYFETIFFSIDSENIFDYEKVLKFINDFNLKDKVYFNLIISPGKENIAYEQFEKLYDLGFKKFNILPVYYTKKWLKNDLYNLSLVLKKIVDKSLIDNKIELYGFQNNNGYNSSLINNSLFIDTDLKVYYSDIVSTNIGKNIKKDLFISNLSDINVEKFNNENKRDLLESYEKNIIKDIVGQKELHKIMDYFSKYLNNKSNK